MAIWELTAAKVNITFFFCSNHKICLGIQITSLYLPYLFYFSILYNKKISTICGVKIYIIRKKREGKKQQNKIQSQRMNEKKKRKQFTKIGKQKNKMQKNTTDPNKVKIMKKITVGGVDNNISLR